MQPRVLICPRCRERPKRAHGYCVPCHAEYMREWRSRNYPTDEQRGKSNARAYAHVYLRRGKLKRQPCEAIVLTGDRAGERCNAKAQMHHEDYSRPLDVTWLCRPCHLALHARCAR